MLIALIPLLAWPLRLQSPTPRVQVFLAQLLVRRTQTSIILGLESLGILGFRGED